MEVVNLSVNQVYYASCDKSEPLKMTMHRTFQWLYKLSATDIWAVLWISESTYRWRTSPTVNEIPSSAEAWNARGD